MRTYAVVLTDRADAEVENIYLWHSQRSPEQAHRWHAGFVATLGSLRALPSRCAVAREDDAFANVTVRQLLYGKYRILFHIVEPEVEEEEGVVRVLHVRHGAQQRFAEPGSDEADEAV